MVKGRDISLCKSFGCHHPKKGENIMSSLFLHTFPPKKERTSLYRGIHRQKEERGIHEKNKRGRGLTHKETLAAYSLKPVTPHSSLPNSGNHPLFFPYESSRHNHHHHLLHTYSLNLTSPLNIFPKANATPSLLGKKTTIFSFFLDQQKLSLTRSHKPLSPSPSCAQPIHTRAALFHSRKPYSAPHSSTSPSRLHQPQISSSLSSLPTSPGSCTSDTLPASILIASFAGIPPCLDLQRNRV